jgi:hypothetical protein
MMLSVALCLLSAEVALKVYGCERFIIIIIYLLFSVPLGSA